MPTREQIEKMPAGSDIEILVSDEVLKLSKEEWNKRFFNNRTRFSTDMNCAWEIVEKVGLMVRPSILVGKWVAMKFERVYLSGKWEGIGEVTADTAPLAICRAALLAVQSASPTHDLP